MNRMGFTASALLRGFVCVIAIACAGTATAQAWTQLSPTGGPPFAREGSTAVYDAAGNNMIVFGGYAFSSGYANDVWVLSHANGSGGAPAWSLLSTSGGPPSARYVHTAVYDAAGNNLIVFGGCSSSVCPMNDVWVLSNANGSGGTPTWTKLSPSGGPPAARDEHTAVYDATGNNMIVFGGCSNSGGCPLNDVWVLSHANGSGGTPTWTQLSPGGLVGLYLGHTAVYDDAGNNMIMFGGIDNFGDILNSVWVLSHANGSGGTPAWTQLSPSGGPPAGRSGHTAVYDAASNNMIVFAGETSTWFVNDVWVLSHANGSGGTPRWTQLAPTGGPPAVRDQHTAVYDAAGNNMVVFGGYDNSTFKNDTWVLSNASPPNNIPVGIAIRPNRTGNTISLSNTPTVPVAILSSANFDATKQVVRTSLTFGHSGTEHSLVGCSSRYLDVNADGLPDLTCTFNVSQTGFQIGDKTGYLQGMTTVGNSISGNDVVNIVK